jgi:AcrR family transcriptional regulator
MSNTATPDPATTKQSVVAVAWATIGSTLLDPGSSSLDPYLDATADVLQRQGWSKTTIPDIARTLGVSRTTAYRQLRSVDAAVRMLAFRELRRLMERLPTALPLSDTAETIAASLVATVAFVSDHPVVKKLVEDEPELITAFAFSAHDALITMLKPAIEPLLKSAIAAGAISPHEPEAVVEWLVRIGTSVVLHPPRRPLEAFVKSLVVPYLGGGGR